MLLPVCAFLDNQYSPADLTIFPKSTSAVPVLQDWPHIPYGSGSVDISLGSTSGLVGVSAAATADGHLQLTTTSATVTIGSVNLSFHGSLWDWLIDIFKGELSLRRGRHNCLQRSNSCSARRPSSACPAAFNPHPPRAHLPVA